MISPRALLGRFFALAARMRTSTRIALAVATATGIALCLSPVLGIPGLESALVLGVVLPPFALVIGVRSVVAARASAEPQGWSRVLGGAIASALGVTAAPVSLLLLNLLRVPACDPLSGLGFLLLGPIAGVLLAVSLGVLIGAALPTRPKLATWMAGLVPFVAIGLAIYDFWRTPAIFAYAHFAGYFPGTLYDPDVELTATYASFRAITLAWTLGGWALFAALWDGARLHARREGVRASIAGAIAIAAAVTGEIVDVHLGHASTAASIAEVLGGRLEGERCIVVLPRETPRADARRLVDDCDFRVERAERVLGVRQPRRITAFFFRSAEEKRTLMGASSTYIAKPWRDEVYLQVGDWPHPVLFHEITHVVAGNVGRGPFRVAGAFSGWLPNPAIIEGVAMAVEWREVDGLTLHQWSRAMLELELAPPLSSVDGLEFMLSPAGRAYVTTGSFVRWMRDTRGPSSVRRLYLTGDLEEALGTSLESAEREWHTFLREEVELPPEALALARARFERPGIFGQICPHAIANMQRDLAADVAAGADQSAARTCDRILELDPGQASVRASLASVLARMGRLDEARGEIATLVGPPSAASPIVASARLGLADALWTRGRAGDALTIYRELIASPLSEDEARQIEVRLLAIDAGGTQERHLRMLLVPPSDRTNDPATVMWAIDGVEGDGLGPYLAARQLASRQRYDLASEPIARARREGLPTPRLEREARRLAGVVAYGAGEIDRSEAIFREIAGDASLAEGKRVEARDWLERIAWRRRH